MGPWGGFITGLAESIEYIMTPAVIVFFIGSYLTGIFETPAAVPTAMVDRLLRAVRRSSIYVGVELSFKISVVVTVLALAVLVVFWVSAIPHADFSRWALNIAVGPDGKPMELPQGGGPFLPFGWRGVLAALPFAVWLFLAIEELPLAAEESVDPKKDMPKGLIFGMFTLMFSALMIMFLNAVASARPEEGKLHGAYSLATSAEPLLDGFRVIFGARYREGAGAARGDRPDRELPHHHLCVRPADLFAVARGLLPRAACRSRTARARRRTSRCSPAR